MESKVSEGGLNVTLTIRLLMHGKVMWGRNQGTARRDLLCTPCATQSQNCNGVACAVQFIPFLELLKTA